MSRLDETAHGLARSTDPRTSWEAAQRVDVKKGERMVINALLQHGAMTQEEVGEVYGKPSDALGPRFKPLLERNIIMVQRDITGEPVTRPGRSGRARLVYQMQINFHQWKEKPEKTPLTMRQKLKLATDALSEIARHNCLDACATASDCLDEIDGKTSE